MYVIGLCGIRLEPNYTWPEIIGYMHAWDIRRFVVTTMNGFLILIIIQRIISFPISHDLFQPKGDIQLRKRFSYEKHDAGKAFTSFYSWGGEPLNFTCTPIPTFHVQHDK